MNSPLLKAQITQPSSPEKSSKSQQLTPDEVERFSRQLILPGWSSQFQLKLAEIKVGVDSRLFFVRRYLSAAGLNVTELNILGLNILELEQLQREAEWQAPQVSSTTNRGVDYLVSIADDPVTLPHATQLHFVIPQSLLITPRSNTSPATSQLSPSMTRTAYNRHGITILSSRGEEMHFVEAQYLTPLLENWISAMIISHLRAGQKQIFSIATMLFT